MQSLSIDHLARHILQSQFPVYRLRSDLRQDVEDTDHMTFKAHKLFIVAEEQWAAACYASDIPNIPKLHCPVCTAADDFGMIRSKFDTSHST